MKSSSLLRHVWVAICLWAASASVAVTAEGTTNVYARDVEFLLAELPKHAGRFFAIKEIDWLAVSNDFTAQVATVTNDAQHVKLCQRLLARLKDGHARLTDVKVTVPDASRGRRWTGPRVHLLVVGERVFVRQAFGAAAEQGGKTGSEVLRVDDLPAREWLARRVNGWPDA